MDNNQKYNLDIIAAMAERTIKRLWIVIILLVLLLFGTNAAWIYYESQWEVVETNIESEQRSMTGSNYVAGGDLYELPESENHD